LTKLSKTILGQAAYERIKALILDGSLAPAVRLNKPDLAARLNISQTPVNDAIARLAGEGFIDQRGRDGYFVRAYNLKELSELYAIRAGIEGMALRLAISEASDTALECFGDFFSGFELPLSPETESAYKKEDIAFHESIITLSGNSMLMEQDERFGYILRCYSHGLLRPPNETLSEHRNIMELARERRAKEAGDLVAEHHLKTRDLLNEAIRRGVD
jgi:DNA-binding GntR family transcriptional regulator